MWLFCAVLEYESTGMLWREIVLIEIVLFYQRKRDFMYGTGTVPTQNIYLWLSYADVFRGSFEKKERGYFPNIFYKNNQN